MKPTIFFLKNSDKFAFCIISFFIIITTSYPILIDNKIHALLCMSLTGFFCLLLTQIPKFLLKFKIQKLKPGNLCVVKLYNFHECVYFADIYKHFNYNTKICVYNDEILLLLEKPIIKINSDFTRLTNRFYLSGSKVKVLYKNKIYWADPRFLEKIS